jgi:two-component system alkaline phosphatase synthesis response regulator PhoP
MVSPMTKMILIVEDEPSIIEALKFLMEQCGHQVVISSDGEGAIESIDKFKPDLILLDIVLPGIDGFEVCEVVRLNPKWQEMKIVFLTAKNDEVDIAKGLAVGADAYIMKPFSNAGLVSKVEDLLSKTYN